MPDLLSMAIIGSGLTGTAMLHQLVGSIREKSASKGQLPPKIQLIVFEQNSLPGPGLPYAASQIFPCHITNMPAGDMSIDAGNPDDLISWILQQGPDLANRFPQIDHKRFTRDMADARQTCLPRALVGEYLICRFNTAVQTAGHLGMDVQVLCRHTVTDIRDNGRYLSIDARDNIFRITRTFHTGHALLATGHWPNRSQKNNRYFSSPWPAARLIEQIPKGANVAVLGTSLSAIDTVLTLFSDGCLQETRQGILNFIPTDPSRDITLYSRNGLLPKVQGPPGRYQNRFLTDGAFSDPGGTPAKRTRLHDFFDLLNKEMAAGYGRIPDWKKWLSPESDPATQLKNDIYQAVNGDNPDGDIRWQTILSQAIPLIKRTYLDLTHDQRYWFETKFKSAFMAHAAAMPLENAKKLLAYMDAGGLRIQKLQEAYQLKSLPDDQGFELRYDGKDGNPICRRHAFLIDARGQSVSYRSNRSKVAKNILKNGIVQIEPTRLTPHAKSALNNPPPSIRETGALWIDPDTHQVRTRTTAGRVVVSDRLFAVGIMTRAQVINASMARECAAATHRVAQIIIQKIWVN